MVDGLLLADIPLRFDIQTLLVSLLAVVDGELGPGHVRLRLHVFIRALLTVHLHFHVLLVVQQLPVERLFLFLRSLVNLLRNVHLDGQRVEFEAGIGLQRGHVLWGGLYSVLLLYFGRRRRERVDTLSCGALDDTLLVL